jgi:hypothetical protein
MSERTVAVRDLAGRFPLWVWHDANLILIHEQEERPPVPPRYTATYWVLRRSLDEKLSSLDYVFQPDDRVWPFDLRGDQLPHRYEDVLALSDWRSWKSPVEVSAGLAFRRKGSETFGYPTHVHYGGFEGLTGIYRLSYDDAFKDWECLAPGDCLWRPCGTRDLRIKET